MRIKPSITVFSVSILFMIVLIFTLRFDPEVKDLEDGVYNNLLVSVVEDGDLNIINQISEKRRMIVSKTFNYPNLHDHGVAALWLPFYYYANIINKIEVSKGYYLSSNYRVAMVIANVFTGMVILLMIYRFIPILFDQRANFFDISCILFGTSIYWYSFIHPSSSDLVSAIFPFLFFVIIKKCSDNPSRENHLILGASLGYGVVLKVSLLFYGILPLFLLLRFRHDLKSYFFKFFSFIVLGGILPIIPYLLNEYIETGYFLYSYSTIVANYYLFYETVFAPAGYFVVSPLFFTVFVCYFFLIISKGDIRRKLLISFFLIAPVLKVLVESFTYAGNAEYGARHLLTDIFVLLLLYPSFYFSGWRKSLLRLIALLCTLQSLFMSFVYMRDISGGFNWGIFYEKDFSAISNQIPKYKYFLSNVLNGLRGDEISGILIFYPLVIILSYFIVKLYEKDFVNSNIIRNFIVYCCCVYIFITSMNLWNNSANIESLKKEGFYEDKVITGGALMYGFNDNVGNLLMHNRFSRARGDIESVELTDKVLREYSQSAVEEIITDPIGLKERILSGDYEFIDF